MDEMRKVLQVEGMVYAKTGGLEAPFCVWGSADALVPMLEQSARPTHREKGTCQGRQRRILKAIDGSRGGAHKSRLEMGQQVHLEHPVLKQPLSLGRVALRHKRKDKRRRREAV